MENYSGKEKRKTPRLYRPFVISYKTLGKEKALAKISQIRNISEGGFAFLAEEELIPGEILQLYIRLPFASAAIEAKGKVASSCRIPQELFCETRVIFTEISEDAKNKIRETIKNIKKG